MCRITDIARQDKIDWMAHDPETRAWVYVEKYRRYWLKECHKRAFSWDAANDLFGDTIVLNVLKYSRRYDEMYGLAFTTYMARNLMWEVSRPHVYEERLKNPPPKIINETDLRKRNEYVWNFTEAVSLKTAMAKTKQGSMDDLYGAENPVEALENSHDLRHALASLKSFNPQAHDIFVGHVLEEYPISTLCQIHRISRWLVGELIKDAKKYLCQHLTR